MYFQILQIIKASDLQKEVRKWTSAFGKDPFFYHIANAQDLSAINSIGLIPRNNKPIYFYERRRVGFWLNQIYTYLNYNRISKQSDIVIVRFKKKGFPNTFYKDDKTPDTYYTDDTIRTRNIQKGVSA